MPHLISDVRNPDTLYILSLLLLAGVGQLASGAESNSVEELVPEWLLTGWAVILILGAGISLLGLLWPGRLTGLSIEVVGRSMLGPAALAYGVAVASVGGFDAALIVALLLGLAAASMWRVHQIRKRLVRLRHDMTALRRARGVA